jgi:hypothetical protein
VPSLDASGGFIALVRESSRSAAQYQIGKGHLLQEMAVEERYVYEIIWLCLVITLTNLDEVRKIRGIQGTKEKTTSELSSFGRHTELLIAISSRLKA